MLWAHASPQPKRHLDRFSRVCTDDRSVLILVCLFPLKIVPHTPYSYALLRRLAQTSVVCLSLCQSVTLVSPAKTAETIKLPFAFRTRVGPMNHVLHEVQMPTHFAI